MEKNPEPCELCTTGVHGRNISAAFRKTLEDIRHVLAVFSNIAKIQQALNRLDFSSVTDGETTSVELTCCGQQLDEKHWEISIDPDTTLSFEAYPLSMFLTLKTAWPDETVPRGFSTHNDGAIIDRGEMAYVKKTPGENPSSSHQRVYQCKMQHKCAEEFTIACSIE